MNRDLTVGNPRTVVLRYALPMFVSVIFQQLYNIADSVIAGNFAGEDALSAIGASYPITMIFMAIAVGSNIGCSVVISRLFGAKDYTQMKTAVSTSLFSSLVLSGLLTAIGIAVTSPMLRLLQTPDNIMADASAYLAIYIGGFAFLFLYNVCTGIFQSLGDSRTPLYFLIASSVANVALDLLFVAKFHWGVSGAAWATFLAQGAACVLAFVALLRRLRKIRTPEPATRFSLDMLRQIAGIAIPSILQQSFVSVGNLLIQSLINSYGSAVIAGYSSAIKLNTFAVTSFSTLANGVSGFTAQNVGAEKFRRIAAGFRVGAVAVAGISVAFSVLFVVAGRPLMHLFLRDGTALAYDTGVQFLRIVAPFYITVALKIVADAVLRGTGAMRQFMITTFTDLILRVLLAYALEDSLEATGIWISWPIGWAIASGLSLFFYSKQEFHRLAELPEKHEA